MSTNQRRDPQDRAEQLDRAAIFYRGNITRAEKVATLKMHPGWQAIIEESTLATDLIESKLHNFEKLTDLDIRMYLKEKKDLGNILNAVENAEDAIAENHQKLAQVESELNERKIVARPSQS